MRALKTSVCPVVMECFELVITATGGLERISASDAPTIHLGCPLSQFAIIHGQHLLPRERYGAEGRCFKPTKSCASAGEAGAYGESAHRPRPAGTEPRWRSAWSRVSKVKERNTFRASRGPAAALRPAGCEQTEESGQRQLALDRVLLGLREREGLRRFRDVLTASSAGDGEMEVRQKIVQTGDVDVAISSAPTSFHPRRPL